MKRPLTTVMYHTKEHEVVIRVYQQSDYAVLDIGDITIFPSVEQLRQLQLEITKYLVKLPPEV